MGEVAEFYRLHNTVQAGEARLKEVKKTLKEAYAKFVLICPHPEAIDWNYGRQGTFRVCMVCGVTDYASEGGTEGDEYNYGYPGSPNKQFWKNSNIRKAESEKEHWKYRVGHEWIVRDGKVVDRYAKHVS